MRTIHATLLLGLVLAVSAGCGGKKDDPKSGDPKAGPAAAAGIEGEWIVVGGEMFGEPATKQEIEKDSEADRTIRITKDTIEMKVFGDKTEKLKYTIDASKNPAHIDIVMPEKGKEKKSETSYGIYKVEGGSLTFFPIGAMDAKNRPTEFKTLKPDPKSKGDGADKPGGLMILTAKKK
jgi:uncharacterized protein (TIGR03067 family)